MEHLSLDALADLLAAEGSPQDEAHVSSCAGCAGRLDELAGAQAQVAAVLASLPAPALPPGLADRLHAAVEAEPPLNAGDVPAAAAASPPGASSPGASARAAGTGGATVTPFPSAGSARRRSWGPLSAAAAVLVVASGAVFGLSQLGGGGGDDESTTSAASDTGAGAAEDAGLVRNETGTDYAAEGALAAAVPSLLTGSEAAAAGAQQEQSRLSAAPELDRLRTPEGLASCLTTLLPAEEPDLRPVAVDYAAYAGQPAAVVLLPATGGAAKVDVFVVGADCAAGDAQLLYFTQVDRP